MNNINESKEVECGEALLNKTENIGRSIDEIESVIEHLTELLNRVSGNDANKICDVDPKKPYYCLAEIMNNGPDTIRNKCSILHDKLNELNDLLY